MFQAVLCIVMQVSSVHRCLFRVFLSSFHLDSPKLQDMIYVRQSQESLPDDKQPWRRHSAAAFQGGQCQIQVPFILQPHQKR